MSTLFQVNIRFPRMNQKSFQSSIVNLLVAVVIIRTFLLKNGNYLGEITFPNP